MTEKSISQVYDLVGLHHSHPISTLMANLKNMKSFADKLDAIEREFFMVEGDQDDDYPNEEPEPVCLVSKFGTTTEQYIEQFREALKIMPVMKSQ